MRTYGMNKATEFSRKQIGVIYRLAKNGDLKVEKAIMSDFYDLADYYGYDYNKSVEDDEAWVLRILDAIFSENLEKAQKLIDVFTESYYPRLSRKNREKADRSLI